MPNIDQDPLMKLPIPQLGRPELYNDIGSANGTLLVLETLGKASYLAYADQVIAEEKASKSLTEDAVL
jgi:hypothetical protein